MDTILLGITGISLILAVGMGLVLFRVVREEGQRSEARVALLKAAAGPVEPALTLWEPEELPSDSPATQAAQPHHGMFSAPEEPGPWARRVAVAAALGALVLTAAYALAPGGRSGPAVTPAASAPLELLALRHTQEGGALTISGLVQNPRGGSAITRVSATASLFGADGALLASGRAGLDFARLAPGDESPFVIKVPVTGTVSRYRVGFRGPDGAVIAHVDRRAGGASARNERLPENVPWVH